jgi:hypothetical protein
VKEYDSAIVSRIAETWCWLLVPSKQLRSSDTHWQEMRLQGTGPLAARASAKLQSDAVMLEKIGPTVLRHHMDDVPMWRDDRLSVQELIAYFSAFLYLPKIATTKTLLEAIAEGVSLTSWEQEGFAYADAYDEATGRYQGLRVGTLPKIGEADQGILVNPSAARAQLDAEAKARAEDRDAPPGTVPSGNAASEGNGNQQGEERPPRRLDPTEFHGSVSLSATKLTPQVAKISEEIIQHLAAKLGVEIKITIDIQATLGTGFDADTVRTVTENSVALKFDHQGFEAPRSE